MAQHDYNIANASFPTVRTDINNVLSAINTCNSGSSRPSGAVAGTIWLDTSGDVTAHLLKFYDGGADILLATINTTANTVDFSDSASDLLSDTTPQLGGQLDVNGQALGSGTLELLKFVETGSAVNELTITNNSTGNNPILSATGDDTNIGIALTPKGTGEIVIGSGNLNYAGTAVTATGAELNKLASAGTLKQAGKETIWVPANAMTPTESNGCADIAKVETTAGRPDLNVLDFDASSDEHAQFSVAFPKQWNLGTITFQCFWTSTATDTDGVSFGLQGVGMGDNETQDAAYGTAIVVDDACQGAAEELYVTAESGAVTIAGTPADNDLTYFRIFRDVSDANDTAAEDARLIGVKIFFTTDAANDA
jgi:hypothetical protein